MRRLASNILFLGLIVSVFLVLIVGTSPHDTNNYLAAALDKHRLLYLTKSPKIILVGGSNLAFSVNSEKIERRFGMPVINMGLHGDLGLRYMLNEAASAIRSGDIVVVFPEYELFHKIPLNGYPRELGSVIKLCFDCISGLSTTGQFFNVLVGFLQMSEGDILRNIKGPDIHDKVYYRQAFNENGDLISHLKRPDKLTPNNHVDQIEIISPNPAVTLLNVFYRSGSSANAQMLFMFPAIPVDEYNTQKEKLQAFYDQLTSELEIPIVGSPQDFIYPEDYFYDTVYHMNSIGRDVHTDHIIELLSSVLDK